jgi:hypothetical protein
MTYEERRTAVVRDPAGPSNATIRSTDGSRVVTEHQTSSVQPSGATIATRVVILVFGLIQLLIGLRILLLALDAREGNAIVSAILQASQVLVAPFEGILRTNALEAGGSVLDLAAVVALVGWTILELIVLAVLRVARQGDRA